MMDYTLPLIKSEKADVISGTQHFGTVMRTSQIFVLMMMMNHKPSVI
jgi:hypothetical protein